MSRSEVMRALEDVAGALQALHIQLRVHRNMLAHWGYARLALQYSKAQADLGLALDAVIGHALSLERQIDLTPALKLNIGQTVEEILVSDRAVALAVSKLAFEQAHLGRVTEGSLSCLGYWSAFLDQQLELVRQMGLSCYLALMAQPEYRPNESSSLA